MDPATTKYRIGAEEAYLAHNQGDGCSKQPSDIKPLLLFSNFQKSFLFKTQILKREVAIDVLG